MSTGTAILGLMLAAVGFAWAGVLMLRLRRQAEEIRAMKEVAKDKDEFISMVLHFVRTPLTGIKWLLAALTNKENPKPLEPADLEILLEENERALSAVDHLLKAAEASAEKTTYALEVLPAGVVLQVVEEAVNGLRSAAKAASVTLHESIPKSLSGFSVRVDREKIRIVLQSLLSNAILYSEAGGTVEFSLEAKDSKLIIRVSDTGIGIAKKDQSKIFNRYFRSVRARQKNADGFGVSLYLAKRFVDGHGGSLSFSSLEGQGTIFTLTLPLRRETLLPAKP